MITPERIFRLQCQASHTRKSISAIANELLFDPQTLTVSAFIELLDQVHQSSGKPHLFKEEIDFVITPDESP